MPKPTEEIFSPLHMPEADSPTSFEVLLWPLVEPGFRLALAMLGDWHEAEDAVQEATVKAWQSASRLRAPVALRAWYLAIVANHCRSVRRGRWFRLLRHPDPARGVPDPGVDIDGLATTEDLRQALRRLPPDDRCILLLVYGMDLPLAEAAQALGLSQGAAKSRLYRAVARLRPHVHWDGEDLP